MSVALTPAEEAQLAQTIEMFEVITQSQPLDYQSLEILKEAYSKLGRHDETVRTSKRIAEAYVLLGQLSSAILEYESILQRLPDDPDVRRALADIELKANNVSAPRPTLQAEDRAHAPAPAPAPARKEKRPAAPIDDGRQPMHSIFVDGKHVSDTDFNACWPVVDLHATPRQTTEPFIQTLSDRGLVPLETSLKLLVERTRHCYLPMEKYDIDIDLTRSFSREVCQRWCILPFDRMSKSVLIATANPFNKQAAHEIASQMKGRLLWYIASPVELIKALRKAFR